MPLSSPVGGAVDLISEEIVTTANNSVIFSPVNINADKAYTIQYEIVPNFPGPGGFPTNVYPQVNGLLVPGANWVPAMIQCSFGCNSFNWIDIFQNSCDLFFGTCTFRRQNVNNFVCGESSQHQYNGGGVVEFGYGTWQIFPTTFTNVTSVGMEANTPTLFFGVGSVFRLYAGTG